MQLYNVIGWEETKIGTRKFVSKKRVLNSKLLTFDQATILRSKFLFLMGNKCKCKLELVLDV